MEDRSNKIIQQDGNIPVSCQFVMPGGCQKREVKKSKLVLMLN
jgi:hypothetical protein